MGKFKLIKKSLVKMLQESPYSYPKPSAEDMADQIEQFVADQIRAGADLGFWGGDLSKLITLFLDKN